MESTKETGCEAREGPILCINNCGFFGTATTMNMCSMCHKDVVLKQWQAKLAAASIENMVDGSSSNRMDTLPAHAHAHALNVEAAPIELKVESPIRMPDAAAVSEPKAKKGPNRCSSCRKRVGLTGFSCRCGILFCSVHRYSDKHECQFDYRSAGQDAIARANPVVKAEKLGKM